MMNFCSPESDPDGTPGDFLRQQGFRESLDALHQSPTSGWAKSDHDVTPSSEAEISSDPFADARMPKRFSGKGTFKLEALPRVVDHTNWAVQKAEQRVAALALVLQELAHERQLPYADDIQVLLIGSMSTGHFTGPKPKEHSLNPACPYDEVVEGDLRVIVPAEVDPHDINAIALVRDALSQFGSIHNVRLAEIHRGDTDMHQTYFYQYDEVSGDHAVGYEWEVCLNNEPYYEIAESWKNVFTPEEIADQVVIRELLRHLEAPLASEFKPTKDIHCNECYWRVIASYALDSLQRDYGVSLPEEVAGSLPMQGKAPASLSFLVDSWLKGEDKYLAINRPGMTLIPDAELRFKEFAREVETTDPEQATAIEALSRPSEGPLWVRYATTVQEFLRAKRNALMSESSDANTDS